MADNKKKQKSGINPNAKFRIINLETETRIDPLEADEAEELAVIQSVPEAPPQNPALSKGWRLKMSEAEVLSVMERAKFGVYKLIPWGSNYTFLAALRDEANDGTEYAVVYKPMKGEAPLWDFPSGTLYRREQAAYVVSRALDWNFIPPVIIRDGPHGVGTVQLFIDVDEQAEFHTFGQKHAHELKRIAVFDMITNNADRKAGHCLLGFDDFIWGIDHGLCFNTVPKLRTIIWDYSGQPFPDDIYEDLFNFATDAGRVSKLQDELADLLDRREVELLFRRLEQILETPVFPSFNSRRQIPWGFF